MAENTNQAQKEALMKGSPWLKDLMLNPHLNKFMKDFEKAYLKEDTMAFNVGRFSIKMFGISKEYGASILIKLNGEHFIDGTEETYDKVNVFDLILRYACLHKGMMFHIAEPGNPEQVVFCDPIDLFTKGRKESTFFDIFYLCKHRTKVEDKKHHEITKYHDNSK
jgi:hypothetical protein